MNRRPYTIISRKAAEDVQQRALAGQFGLRCFLGIHEWVRHGSPIEAQRYIAVYTRCWRCGWLKDIEML